VQMQHRGHAEAIWRASAARGRRPWGRRGAPVASPAPTVSSRGRRQGEREKVGKEGLAGGVHLAATKRRGGWQAGWLAVLGRKG
jgi:hypothetical protein